MSALPALILAVLFCAGFLTACPGGSPETSAPTYTIRGAISKSDGGPAAGASVQLRKSGTNIGAPVTAGTDGKYTIGDVAEGTYTIQASLAGYNTGETTPFVVSADVANKDLILVQTGGASYTVSGTITTSDAASAAGAAVQLKQAGTPIGAAATAGADGTYTVSGVPAGEYTIEVSLTGYTTGTIPAFTVSGANVTGKDLVLQKIVVDTTPPAKVTSLTGTPGEGQVTLAWIDPADADLASIEITWTPGGETVRTAAKGVQTYTATGLTNGTGYTFSLIAVDATGNKSEAETVNATPADAAPPAKVTGLAGTPGNGKVRLDWTDPADADLAAIEITFTPAVTDLAQPISVTKSAAADRANYKIIEELANDTPYTFTVKAKDASGNLSAGEVSEAITPLSTLNADLTPPAEVTGLDGTAGNAEATLTWADPADTDLDHIEITWEPGGGSTTVTKGTETYTATGLTNGTEYAFTVKAVDNAAPTANKSAGETKTLTPLTPLAPTARVTVNFTGLPQDETITLDGAAESLSHAANTAITVSVGGGSFTAYSWYLDGVLIPGQTGNTLTGNAGSLTVKRHELTVFVTSGGIEYAKAVYFTVTP